MKNFPTFAVPSETEGKTQEIDSVPYGAVEIAEARSGGAEVL
ncbi:hypothetical protein [Sphingobacterium haloxyli]|nr:hypothetical protein [Sphingobacterium haloxyli]